MLFFLLFALIVDHVAPTKQVYTAQWPKFGFNNNRTSQAPYSLGFSGDPLALVRYQTGSFVRSSPAIAQDGSIVVGSDDDYIYCLTSTGSLRWRYQTGSAVQSSPAIAQDGSIVVGSEDDYIYCLTSTEIGRASCRERV
jgi:outer membrane protein assembly factor BamB